MPGIEYRPARENDWPLLAGLLAGTGLSTVGAREHLKHFLLAFDEHGLIGCAGMEKYGNYGLLRSVAVVEAERGQGYGQTLVEKQLLKAQQEGVRHVVLFANGADDFFQKFDFTATRRETIPATVKDSVEFKFALPESTAMLLDL
jgi:amino-acid N-acetyltransferase